MDASPDPHRLEILVFRVGAERFGLPLASVRRVLAAVEVTRVPGVPRGVSGIVDVHGSLIPVFDPRARFGRASREIDADDRFVLADAGDRRVLLHVDEVFDVVSVGAAAVREAGDVVGEGEHRFGVATLPEGLLLIHDLVGFLSDAEAAELDEALASERGRAHA